MPDIDDIATAAEAFFRVSTDAGVSYAYSEAQYDAAVRLPYSKDVEIGMVQVRKAKGYANEVQLCRREAHDAQFVEAFGLYRDDGSEKMQVIVRVDDAWHTIGTAPAPVHKRVGAYDSQMQSRLDVFVAYHECWSLQLPRPGLLEEDKIKFPDTYAKVMAMFESR